MSSAPEGGSPLGRLIKIFRIPERPGSLLLFVLLRGVGTVFLAFHSLRRAVGHPGLFTDPGGAPVQPLDRFLVLFQEGKHLRGREADQETVPQDADSLVGAPHDIENPVGIGSPGDDDPRVPLPSQGDFPFDPVGQSVLLFHASFLLKRCFSFPVQLDPDADHRDHDEDHGREHNEPGRYEENRLELDDPPLNLLQCPLREPGTEDRKKRRDPFFREDDQVQEVEQDEGQHHLENRPNDRPAHEASDHDPGELPGVIPSHSPYENGVADAEAERDQENETLVERRWFRIPEHRDQFFQDPDCHGGKEGTHESAYQGALETRLEVLDPVLGCEKSLRYLASLPVHGGEFFDFGQGVDNSLRLRLSAATRDDNRSASARHDRFLFT